MSVRWEIEIERNGLWPFPWKWVVWRRDGVAMSLRTGYALTKDRARRKAARAQRSMERDDVRITSEA